MRLLAFFLLTLLLHVNSALQLVLFVRRAHSRLSLMSIITLGCCLTVSQSVSHLYYVYKSGVTLPQMEHSVFLVELSEISIGPIPEFTKVPLN